MQLFKTARPACLSINDQAMLPSTCHRHSSMQLEILGAAKSVGLKRAVHTGHFLKRTTIS